MQPPCRSVPGLARGHGRNGCIPLVCKQLCHQGERPRAAHLWRGMWRKGNRVARGRRFNATREAKRQREKPVGDWSIFRRERLAF